MNRRSSDRRYSRWPRPTARSRIRITARHSPRLEHACDTDALAALFAQQGVEVLLSASNGPAERIDEVWGDRHDGGFSEIASAAAVAGYPSLTVPAGLVRNLPVGITLVGRRNQDGLLLQVARAYERASNAPGRHRASRVERCAWQLARRGQPHGCDRQRRQASSMTAASVS